jgi:hypothetical protein
MFKQYKTQDISQRKRPTHLDSIILPVGALSYVRGQRSNGVELRPGRRCGIESQLEFRLALAAVESGIRRLYRLTSNEGGRDEGGGHEARHR